MSRCLYWFSLFWVPVVSSLAGPPTVLYESPHSELRYEYTRETKGTEAEAWTYRVRTDAGTLRLEVQSDEDRYSVTTELQGEKRREGVILSAPNGPGVGDITLIWPDRGTRVRYVKHEREDDLERVSGRPADCETLVHGSLPQTRRALLGLVHDDFARHYEAPLHLEELAAALHAAVFLPLLAAGCEEAQEPAGGACYYDTTHYIDCLHCCSSYGDITAVVCAITFGQICRYPWCAHLGGFLCGGAVEMAATVCEDHNCRGKPGDPGCDQNQPCEGQCLNFCGPGWSSGCGHCDGESFYQQACCR